MEEVVGVMDSLVVDSADVCMDEVNMVVDGEALCRVVFVLSVVWVVDAGIELVGVDGSCRYHGFTCCGFR